MAVVPVEEPVRVAVRLCPLMSHDMCCIGLEGLDSVCVEGQWLFNFDQVFPPEVSQDNMYQHCVEKLMEPYFQGCNVSVIAYGPSGGGKTHSMIGPSSLGCATVEAQFGIVPRAVRDMFHKIQSLVSCSCCVRVTYLEVFREEVKDLLSMEPYPTDVFIKEDKKGNTVLVGAQELECCSIGEVLGCLETGIALSQSTPSALTGAHNIFIVSLHQTWNEGTLLRQISSRMTFVDLGSCSGEVNSGLLALDNVISALGDPRRKASHVPYRDSKLTRILKDSLGGSSYTMFLCCISPSAHQVGESLSALKMARRVRNIRNRPHLTCPINIGELGTSDQEALQDKVFKLEFASSQWGSLVRSANAILLELHDKGTGGQLCTEIQSWLCLKEEMEDCMQQAAPQQQDRTNTLPVIDEASEPGSSPSPDAHMEQLKVKFRESLEDIIAAIADALDVVDEEEVDIQTDPTPPPPPVHSGRRCSILPGTQEAQDLYLINTRKESDNHSTETSSSGSQSEVNEIDRQREWLNAEEQRIMELQKHTQQMQEVLAERELQLSAREASLNTCEAKSTDIIKEDEEVNEDKNEGNDETKEERKETDVREEINSLRRTRDALIGERENELKEDEQRVIEEAVEALDAAIEFKNELLSGRQMELRHSQLQIGHGKESLLEHLLHLAPCETLSLLCKYFRKVIDLKEDARKTDKQLQEVENQYEEQRRHLRKVTHTLQRTHLEMERRLAFQERNHQERLASVREESGKQRRGYREIRRGIRDVLEMGHLGHTERLKLLELLSGTDPGVPPPAPAPQTIVPKQTSGTRQTSGTTRVTRQKNRIIIQQQPRDKGGGDGGH